MGQLMGHVHTTAFFNGSRERAWAGQREKNKKKNWFYENKAVFYFLRLDSKKNITYRR